MGRSFETSTVPNLKFPNYDSACERSYWDNAGEELDIYSMCFLPKWSHNVFLTCQRREGKKSEEFRKSRIDRGAQIKIDPEHFMQTENVIRAFMLQKTTWLILCECVLYTNTAHSHTFFFNKCTIFCAHLRIFRSVGDEVWRIFKINVFSLLQEKYKIAMIVHISLFIFAVTKKN